MSERGPWEFMRWERFERPHVAWLTASASMSVAAAGMAIQLNSSVAPAVERFDAPVASRIELEFGASSPSLSEIRMGDGWGCAETQDGAHYCWQAPYQELEQGRNVRAYRIAWLDDRRLQVGPDRVCIEENRGLRCWHAPQFLQAESLRDDSESWLLAADIDGRVKNDPIPVAHGLWNGCLGQSCGPAATLRTTIRLCQRGGISVPCEVVDNATLRAMADNPILIIGDLYACARMADGLFCVGASRDGFFGTAAQCPAGLLAAWPTVAGNVAAPNAKCARRPTRVGHLPFQGNFVSVSGRGLCLDHLSFDDMPNLRRTFECFGRVAPASSLMTSPVVGLGDEPSACGFAGDRLVCWGDGYTPGTAEDRLVSIELAVPAYSRAIVRDGSGDYHQRCAIHGGCGKYEIPLSPCPPGATSVSVDALLASSGGTEGRVVTVSGALALERIMHSTANEVACGPFRQDGTTPDRWNGGGSGDFCCYDAHSDVVLTDGRAEIALEGISCAGDTSRLCCNTAALGQQVAVTGTFSRTGGDQAWALKAPQICELAAHGKQRAGRGR